MLVGCGMSAQVMEKLSAFEQVMTTWMGHSDAGMGVGDGSNFVTGWYEGCSVGSSMRADI